MLAEIFGMDGVIVVIVIGMVLFGSSQIPKLARSLGSAQKEFKQGLQEAHTEVVEPRAKSASASAADEVKADL
jgi:sec-independent protein translocase protein TatA